MMDLEIIAEFGTNNVDPNGKVLDNIEELIHTLAKKGATAVKFQYFKADNLVEKDSEIHNIIKGLEVPIEAHVLFKRSCDDAGVKYLCTPFCTESLDELLSIGLREIKIASCDCGNVQLLSDIVERESDIDRVLMSTGMSTLTEVNSALNILIRGAFGIDLLHCTSIYPTPVIKALLNRINVLKRRFGRIAHVGYSDHTLGVEVAPIARAMGCTIFEKHVTPDVNMPGLDHAYSFPIDKFEEYVGAIKRIDEIIEEKEDEDELASREVMKRGIWFNRKLSAGQKINRDDIIVRRPLKGAINQVCYFDVLGKKIKKSVKMNDPVLMENLYE